MIIAIDGPAGAGKSTVAKLIAQKLGFLYIDTGAMYRALTLKAIDLGIDAHDTGRIIELARTTSISFLNNPDCSLKVLLDGKDVSREIREPRITKDVSEIAKIKEVRDVMVNLQRNLGKSSDSVLDGRDIGTVVFPDAFKKFYIDADFKERALRRHKELIETERDISLKEIESDVLNRDTKDLSRKVGPLKKADDALYIDTTNMSIDEVVDTLLSYIKNG